MGKGGGVNPRPFILGRAFDNGTASFLQKLPMIHTELIISGVIFLADAHRRGSA